MDIQNTLNQYIQKWYLAKLNNRRLCEELDALKAELSKLRSKSATDDILQETVKIKFKNKRAMSNTLAILQQVKKLAADLSQTDKGLSLCKTNSFFHKKSFPQFLKKIAINNFNHSGTQTEISNLRHLNGTNIMSIEELGVLILSLKQDIAENLEIEKEKGIMTSKRNGNVRKSLEKDSAQDRQNTDNLLRRSQNLKIRRDATEDIGDTNAALELDSQIALQNNAIKVNEELKRDNERLIQRIKIHLEDNIKLRNEVKALKTRINDQEDENGEINVVKKSFKDERTSNVNEPMVNPINNAIVSKYDKKAIKRPVSVEIHSNVSENNEKIYSDNNSEGRRSQRFKDDWGKPKSVKSTSQDKFDNPYSKKIRQTTLPNIPKSFSINPTYQHSQLRKKRNIDKNTQTLMLNEVNAELAEKSLQRDSFSSTQELLNQTYETKIKYLTKTNSEYENKLRAKEAELDNLREIINKLNDSMIHLNDDFAATRHVFKLEIEALEENYNMRNLEFDELYDDHQKNEVKLKRFIDFLFKGEKFDILDQLKIINAEVEQGVVQA